AWDDREGLVVGITSIDGVKYKGYRGYVNTGWLVRLLPGKHRIGLAYFETASLKTARPEVDVDLEAGKVYVARVRVVGDAVEVRVEEFVPGTSYVFPASALVRNDVDMDRLFEEGLDPQEAARRKKAGLPPRPAPEAASKPD
ncbi:MAG: hypothetical protein ACREO3_11500, partial [Arenimonas sp.]